MEDTFWILMSQTVWESIDRYNIGEHKTKWPGNFPEILNNKSFLFFQNEKSEM